MRNSCNGLICLLVFTCLGISAVSQDSASQSPQITTQYFEKISTKAESLNKKLDSKADQALKKLQKQEAKLKRKLMRTDSVNANLIFADADKKYEELEQRLNFNKAGPYIPKMDTLISSIKFLEQNAQIISQVKDAKEKLREAAAKVNTLKGSFQKAEEVKKILKERTQYLKERLANLSFAKELKKLNKQAYYYSQQINEYKEILKDSKKAERKAIEVLSKTKLFRDFMRKNSQLASLFRLPGDGDDPTLQGSLAGLQTRSQVNQLIQNQIAAGGPGAREQFQQNLQGAQAQLQELKNKILKFGGSNAEGEIPDFKPNNQKTKSFLKRFEYGTNVQTQKSSTIFPITSDIGLSVGYKLNDKSIIGIGGSFKMGWGTGFKNIQISSQGVGLRSFLDYRIKGTFWLSGGFEMNFRSEVREIIQLKDFSGWQHSGLIGVSKVVSLKTKFFKKTKLQLLWDFLSYQQTPNMQAILFRVGYNF